MKTWFSYFILILSLCIFTIGVASKLDDPLTTQDHRSYSAAEDWSKGIHSAWLSDHPPGYPIFLTLLFKIFGASIKAARLANAFCILLVAMFLYKLGRRLASHESGLWAAALYILSPVSIQGITLMDVADTSLLPLGFVILLYSIARVCTSDKFIPDIFFIGVSLAFCLWMKVMSTSVLGLCLFLCLMIYQKRLAKMYLKIIIGAFVGAIIFLTTWSVVSLSLWGNISWGLVIMTPWTSFKGSVVHGINALPFMLNTVRIVLWFSPFLIVLFIWKTYSIWRTRDKEKKSIILLNMIGFLYFLGYLIVGGTNYGFPRYHAAIFPVIALVVALLVEPMISKFTKKDFFAFLGTIAVIVIVFIFFFEDPLLFFNLTFKKIILNNGTLVLHLIRHFFQIFILCLIVFLSVFLFWKRMELTQKFILMSLIGVLGFYSSLNVIQAKAQYSTSYEYGSEGKQEVIRAISDFIDEEETVMATPDLLYQMRSKNIPFIGWSAWLSTVTVLDTIHTSNPKVIVIGLTSHSLKQWQEILGHPDIKLILEKQYIRRDIGTYSVWFKKQSPKTIIKQ